MIVHYLGTAAHRRSWASCLSSKLCQLDLRSSQLSRGAAIIAKYMVGWILGVPVVVLVILYLIFH